MRTEHDGNISLSKKVGNLFETEMAFITKLYSIDHIWTYTIHSYQYSSGNFNPK
jgi:hypothetical protein